MPAPIDLTGHRYGRLVVLEKAKDRKWLCQCDCGNTKEIFGPSMRRGRTTSCGCVHRENRTIHGGCKSRLYRIWRDMKARCNNPKQPGYKWYGAIGVTVCNEWMNSFEKFRDWALTNGYQDHLSIDRIDGALEYGPHTCRWTTDNIQSRNQRKRSGNASSQYIGVHFQKGLNKYRARLKEGERVHEVGVFETEEAAALARDQYIKDHQLEGYPLNFK